MKTTKFNARGKDFSFADNILTLRGEIAVQAPPDKPKAPARDTRTLDMFEMDCPVAKMMLA